MVKKVSNPKELAEAIKAHEDTIEIEADLAKNIYRIHATGKAAWIIAVGAVAVALTAVTLGMRMGGRAKAVSAGLGVGGSAGAIAVLGVSATKLAVQLAFAGGSIAVLTQLRNYEQVSYDGDKLVLRRAQ